MDPDGLIPAAQTYSSLSGDLFNNILCNLLRPMHSSSSYFPCAVLTGIQTVYLSSFIMGLKIFPQPIVNKTLYQTLYLFSRKISYIQSFSTLYPYVKSPVVELPGIPDQSLNPVSIIVPISVHLRKILYTQSSSKYNLNSNSLAIHPPP